MKKLFLFLLTVIPVFAPFRVNAATNFNGYYCDPKQDDSVKSFMEN